MSGGVLCTDCDGDSDGCSLPPRPPAAKCIAREHMVILCAFDDTSM